MANQTPHPTADLNRDNYSVGSGKLKFFDINPPIEDIVIDDKQVNGAFKKYPIIPYAGENEITSHRMCSVLYNFRELSTTYGGILNDLKSYALGRKVEIKKVEDSIFDIADEEIISSEEQRKFNDFIRQNFIFHQSNVLSLAYWLHDSRDSTGQVGVEIIRKTILGKTTITFKYHKPMNYVFLKGKTIGEEVAISPKWDEDWLKDHPPLFVPLYPNIEKGKDGFERTFYFNKNGAELYGRPNDLSCLPDKYNEYKLKQYLTKKNKKLWLPDVFIETQDSAAGGFTNDEKAKGAGYRNSKHRIEQNFTNSGDDASTFMITNRANDAEETFIHEFQGLKNSKEVMNYRLMFKEAICEANGWARALLEMQGTTGLSTNMFLDLFAIKQVTKVAETQMIVETMMNDLFGIGFKLMNAETDKGIKFTSPLKKLIEDYNARNSKGNNNEQPGREGDIGATKTSL